VRKFTFAASDGTWRVKTPITCWNLLTWTNTKALLSALAAADRQPNSRCPLQSSRKWGIHDSWVDGGSDVTTTLAADVAPAPPPVPEPLLAARNAPVSVVAVALPLTAGSTSPPAINALHLYATVQFSHLYPYGNSGRQRVNGTECTILRPSD